VYLVERTGELRAGNVVVGNPDGVEQRLVHQPSDVRGGTEIEVLEVKTSQFQCPRQGVVKLLLVYRQPIQNGLGSAAFPLDAGLLLGIQLFGDVVGIVLVQEFALLLFEAGQDGLASCELLLTDSCQLCQVGLKGTLDTTSPAWPYGCGVAVTAPGSPL
jgi:hypothetical protein